MTAGFVSPFAHRRGTQSKSSVRLVQGLVLTAVLFNAFLAFVNGNGPRLSNAHVVLFEMLIMLTAHATILSRYRKEMFRWYLLIAICLLIALLKSVLQESFELKAFRDVLIIPTFIMLGMCIDEDQGIKAIIALNAIVMFFLLLELAATDRFAAIFKIKEYYVATRGFKDDNFFNKESDLFLSATRPGERFISLFDIHRAASVFLEPPSLGNYCLVLTIFIIVYWDKFSILNKSTLVFSNLLILVASDSRMASASTIFLLMIASVRKWLPPYSAVLYVPVTLIGIIAGTELLGIKTGADDFKGRVAYTVKYITSLDMEDYFGLVVKIPSADSGYGYMLITQTIVGVVIIWLWLSLGVPQSNRRQVLTSHLVWLYVSLNLIVSNSAVSIKTAALLWFILGVVSRSKGGGYASEAGSARRQSEGASDSASSPPGRQAASGAAAGQSVQRR